jgi:hypothetical protein
MVWMKRLREMIFNVSLSMREEEDDDDFEMVLVLILNEDFWRPKIGSQFSH